MFDNFKKFDIICWSGHPYINKKTHSCRLLFGKNDIIIHLPSKKPFDITIPYSTIKYVDITDDWYKKIVLKYFNENSEAIELIFSEGMAFTRRKNRLICIDIINRISMYANLSAENKDILTHKLIPASEYHKSRFESISFSNNRNSFVTMVLYHNFDSTLSDVVTVNFLEKGISVNQFNPAAIICDNLYYIKYDDINSVESQKIIDNSSWIDSPSLTKKVKVCIKYSDNNKQQTLNFVTLAYAQAEIEYDKIISLLSEHFNIEDGSVINEKES